MSAAIFRDWFDPARMYVGGYPPTVSSALRRFGPVRDQLEELIRRIAPARPLEIGPGDRPLIAATPRPTYLDIAPYFLSRLAGRRVAGDLRRPPFREGAFDLVLAIDVLTHIPPAERGAALEAIARLAPRIVTFNPEPGASKGIAAPVDNAGIAAALRALGLAADHHVIAAETWAGEYRMGLVLARRPAEPPFPDVGPRGLALPLAREYEPVQDEIERIVREIAPRRPLEIAPGERPAAAALPPARAGRACYQDAGTWALGALRGDRVAADPVRPPFRAGAFDLVIVNDVLAGVTPGARGAALDAIAALAPRLVILHAEPAGEGEGPLESPAPGGAAVEAALLARGFRVEHRAVAATTAKGERRAAILLARRPGAPAFPPPAGPPWSYVFVRRMNELT